MLEPQLSLCKMFLGSNDWQFWIVFFILSHAARHRHFKIFGIPVDYKNPMHILERLLLQRSWDTYQNRNQRPMNSQMEIFSSFFSDYHFAFLYPEPWDTSIRSTRYVPSSPPSYNTFYRSAEQFEISLLNPDGNGYLPSR